MSLNNYLIPQTLYCKYCGKECKNLNSLKQHECRCKENPNCIDNPRKNKETVLKCSLSLKATLKTKREKRIEEYNKNPKLCLQCNKPLTYKQFKQNIKYCCAKCANLSRPPRSEESKDKTRQSIIKSLFNRKNIGNYNKVNYE